MPKQRNPVTEALTNPYKNFAAFFIGGFLAFNIIATGATNVFWKLFGSWFQEWLGVDKTTSEAIISLAMLILLLLIVYTTNIANFLKRILAVYVSEPVDARVSPLEECFPGLVVIMSPRSDPPAEVAIRHHWNQGRDPHLEHCWIICTETSYQAAQEMHKRLVDDAIAILNHV